MAASENEKTEFLAKLYTLTQGDTAQQHSMYDVGAHLGLEKDLAGKIAEDLIGQGLVEIKTLSGGISITMQGVEAAQSMAGPAESPSEFSLGGGAIIEAPGRTAVDHILGAIKTHFSRNTTPYDQLEELVVDIKTIETQMLSPRPKTAVVRELLRSVQQALAKAGQSDMANQVGRMADA